MHTINTGKFHFHMSVHDRGEMGNGEGQTEYNNIRNRQTEYNNIRNRVMRHIPPTVCTLPPYTSVVGSGRTSYSPLLDKPHPYVQLPRKANCIVCSGREDAKNRKVRRSYLLIHEILSISCSQAHCIPKRKEIYLRYFKNRASLPATASSESQNTSTTISATLVPVLPGGGGQYYRADTNSI